MSKDKKNEIVLKQDRVCGEDFFIIHVPFSLDDFKGNASKRVFLVSYTFPVNDEENDKVNFFDWFHIIDANKHFYDMRWDYDNHTVSIYFSMENIEKAEELILSMIRVGIIGEPMRTVEVEEDSQDD